MGVACYTKENETQKVDSNNPNHNNNISCIIKLESGKLATGAYDNTIKIWNIKSNKCKRTIKEEGNVLCLLEFEKNKILVGNNKSNIRLWDINNPKISENIKRFKGHSSLVNCLVKCNDKLFASASNDKTIKIWDYLNNKCLNTLKGHNNYVYSLALLKDGRLCSGSADNTIKIWNLNDYSCDITLNGHEDTVKCVFQLSNGYILSGSEDNNIIIWYDYNEYLCPLKGHEGGIDGICKISDTIFASSSSDKTIKIWDTITMSCIETLKVNYDDNSNDNIIIPVIYSSGKLIYSIGKTFKIYNYNINNENSNNNININIGKINLTFKTTSGIETNINTEYNKSLNEVIYEYLNEFGQIKLIGKNTIAFLFNGQKLDTHSTQKIEEIINYKNLGTTIIVVDQNNLIRKK